MKVVLLKDVTKVGKKYDVVTVSAGYAENFLIRNGAAKVATPSVIAEVEVKRKQLDEERKIQEDLLLKNLGGIAKAKIEIKEKVNEKGHLFAGIHKERIVEEVKKQTHLIITEDFIELSHPIKEVGEHEIEIKAHGKSAKLKVIVSASEE